MKFRILCAALLLSAVLFSFTGCDLLFPDLPEIRGTWDAGYGITVTVTGDSFSSDDSSSYDWDYSGKIVKFDNDSYNVLSENPSSGNFGSILIKITDHKGDASQIGSYVVLRWRNYSADSSSTTVETSEGYKFGAAAFTDPDAAWEGETAADGYFSNFSTLTLIP